jgi:N-carbamoylputrescine amidase
MQDIKVASVIFDSLLGDVDQNILRMAPWIESAAEKGVSIVCFPEMNITGYSAQPEMHAVAVRDPQKQKIRESLSDLAQKHRVMILAGMAEKDDSGQLFASHMVIGPDSDHIGVYRKLHLAAPEKAHYTSGNDIPLFHFRGVTFGIQLCFDAHFPELSAQMAVQGAEVLFMPHASPRGVPESKYQSWMRHLPARAYDNSLFVIACNQTGSSKNGLLFPGVAISIGPSGKVLAKIVQSREALLVSDLKAEDFFQVRNHRMRFFLPHRRPELYKS